MSPAPLSRFDYPHASRLWLLIFVFCQFVAFPCHTKEIVVLKREIRMIDQLLYMVNDRRNPSAWSATVQLVTLALVMITL